MNKATPGRATSGPRNSRHPGGTVVEALCNDCGTVRKCTSTFSWPQQQSAAPLKDLRRHHRALSDRRRLQLGLAGAAQRRAEPKERSAVRPTRGQPGDAGSARHHVRAGLDR